MIFSYSGKRDKTLPLGADKVDGAPRASEGVTPEDRRPSDIIEQVHKYKEALKPKTPSTSGKHFYHINCHLKN